MIGNGVMKFPILHYCMNYNSYCTRSLATAINNQLREESDPSSAPNRPSIRKSHSESDEQMAILAARVSAKLEEGDFRGAVRLA